MSTRSMTILKDGATPLRLYRHCDGYPAEAGVALAKALVGAKNATQAAAALLRLTYEATGFRASVPIYELADWSPQEQGDLEHVYTARAFRSGWEVEHRARAGWGAQQAPLLKWPSTTYSLSEFAEFTAREAAAMAERVAAYEAQRAGSGVAAP